MNKNNGNSLKDIDLRKKVSNSHENAKVAYLHHCMAKFLEHLRICVTDIAKRVCTCRWMRYLHQMNQNIT